MAQQQGAALLRGGSPQHLTQNRQRPATDADLLWRWLRHPGTLSRSQIPILSGMSDTFTELETKSEFTPGSAQQSNEAGADLSDRFSEVVGKLNASLDAVDWAQVSKFAKASGIILAVIIAQILIKGVLDTINLLPVVPGLLELLGLVVVGQWSWQNLTTSEKRSAVVSKVQNLRKEYLG